MSIITPASITAGILFIFSLASGVWLSQLGKPVNFVVVTIHKLISLAVVIFTGITIYNVSRATGPSPSAWGAILVTGLLFILLFITGALLSGSKPVHIIYSVIHKVVPLLSLFSAAVTVYLLSSGG
jgi:hypothetical protein